MRWFSIDWGSVCLLFGAVITTTLCTADEKEQPKQVFAPSVHEVMTVEPTNFVLHGLDTQSIAENGKIWTRLRGPRFFSQSAGVGKAKVVRPGEHVVWYEIQNPKPANTQQLTVKHPFVRNESIKLTIGKSAYLLCPATLLTNGPPQSVPQSLNYLKAYQISANISFNQSMDLRESLGAAKRTVGKPRFLCLPTEQWHHDDHEAVNDESRLMLVCEASHHDQNTDGATKSISVIDPFGINTLQSKSNDWITVDVELID